MSLLLLLWLVAGTLIGLSFAALAVIAVVRLLRRHRLRVSHRVRAELLTLLIKDEVDGERLRHVVETTRGDVLAVIILQSVSIIRGAARQQFLDRLIEAGAVSALGEILRNGSRMGRVRAAEALAAFDDDQAIAFVRQAWRDQSPRVRFAAFFASIDMGAGPSFEQAFTIALSASGKKRIAADDLLRRLAASKPEEAIDWMRRVALSAALHKVLIDGLALSSCDSPAAISVLKSAATHTDANVRASAVAALASRRMPETYAPIVAALSDKAWTVRVRAASAVGKLRLHDASHTLEQLLSDPEWWVHHRAREALAACGLRSGS